MQTACPSSFRKPLLLCLHFLMVKECVPASQPASLSSPGQEHQPLGDSGSLCWPKPRASKNPESSTPCHFRKKKKGTISMPCYEQCHPWQIHWRSVKSTDVDLVDCLEPEQSHRVFHWGFRAFCAPRATNTAWIDYINFIDSSYASCVIASLK